MHHCDLTGESCEGRVLLKVPGAPPIWISPTTKLLLLQGKNVQEMKDAYRALEDKLGVMDMDERKKFFDGSAIKIYE